MGQVLCPVLVGRESELLVLRRALAALRAGHGGCVVISGEAGIGKSRLVQELSREAGEYGLPMVTGRCVPAGASAPYRPLTEAVQRLLRDRPLLTDPKLAAWLPHLGAIAPPLAARSAAAPVPEPVSAAVRGEALLNLVARVAPDGLVIALEDLHWADPDTVAVTEYLADNAAEQRLLLVLTLRPDEPSPAADAARRQRGRTGITPLPLARLSPGDVGRMIAACVPEVDPELLTRVRDTSEGIPLLVEDLLASPGVPESISEMVDARLGELGADGRAVLEAAALLGRDFDWTLLPAASGRSEEQTAAVLTRGVEQQLVVSDGSGFRFRHALTRDAVVAAMLPPRVREVAVRTLTALEQAHPGLPGHWRDVAADLAGRAGQPDRVGGLLIAAGRESLGVGALATAVDVLTRAETLVAEPADRLAVRTTLVEALVLAGRVDDAVAVGTRLLAELPPGPTTAMTRVDLHLQLARAAVAASGWDLASHHLDAAQAVTGDGAPGRRAGAAVLSAEVAMAARNLDAARAAAEAVLGMDATADVRCHALEVLGRTRRLHDVRGAAAAFEAAWAEAEAAGLPVWRLRALHELGTIDMLERLDPSRLLAARRLGEEMGALSTVAVLDLQLAATYTGRWDLESCDVHAGAAVDRARRLGLDVVAAKGLALLMGSASMRGDVEATRQWAAQAAAATPDDPVLHGFAQASVGLALFLAGQRQEALGPLDRGTAALAALSDVEPMSVRALWPLIQAADGDDRAEETIRQARSSGVEAFHGNAGLLLLAEAVHAGRLGRPARAEELAARAWDASHHTGGWRELARLIAAPAARADGWGDPDAWEASARAALAGLRVVTGPAQNPWSNAGVTDREAEVLHLVMQGLANKDIAARLYLSVRTVEKHLESLRRKTGSRSRTELAVRATRPTT